MITEKLKKDKAFNSLKNDFGSSTLLTASSSKENFTEEIQQVLQKNTMSLLYENLSKYNPDIVSDLLVPSKMVKYQILETEGEPISLSVLKVILQTRLVRSVKFQRESDDHKNKTAQQIVADYLTGQKMGYVSCYKYPNAQQPKLVIDGKHRLTHLENFIDGNLVLKGKEASQFWTKHIDWLVANRAGQVGINKIIRSIERGKIPQVKYTDFKDDFGIFQTIITSNISIKVLDIEVQCTDENGNIVHNPNIDKVEEMYYRKFLKINQNSAKMKNEDIFWGSGSDYNVESRKMVNNEFFQLFFDIDISESKQQRKLNEIILCTLLFLDNKTKWGSGGGSLANKINDPDFADRKIGGESLEFSNWFNSSIMPNFKTLLLSGYKVQLPKNLKGIESTGTNIKYLIYFLYKLHQFSKNSSTFPFYENKIPTPYLIKIIEKAASIISSSIKDKNGNFSLTESTIPLYNSNPNIFEKLNEYRQRQRDKSINIDPLFEEIVKFCI